MFRTASSLSRARDLALGYRPASRRRLGSAAACAAAVVVSASAAGCAVPAQAGPAIQLSSAQVVQPSATGVTDVYVDVSNNGPADKLIAARISVGGQVALRSPLAPGLTQMRTVPSISIAAKSFTGLDPNGSHLLVTNAGPMQAGREITLTLVFAHAGTISVAAIVTNPETGGSSYFLN
jgi:copper(I)-binding protein